MKPQNIVIVILIAVVGVLVYFHFKPEPMPTGVHVIATRAPELAHVGTEFIDFAPIKVFEPEAKRKLKLPDAVQADPNAHVITSTKTANDERQHTVTTLIDKQTGEATTYDRVDPLPWLAVKTTTHVRAYYGLKNTDQAVRLQVQQDFLRVKAIHIEGTASADIGIGKPDTFIGIGGGWDF